ncbi:MAG: MarR family transcriptional regulator [bacterium]
MDTQKFVTEDCMSYVMGKTVQSIKNLIFREFKSRNFNITPEQWAVMSYLHKEDGLYQKQIADFLFKDKPTVTRILDILEKRNLIIRISDEKDRRKFKIYLTQDGKDTVVQLLPVAKEVQHKIKEKITAEEIEILKTILNKIYLNSTGNF